MIQAILDTLEVVGRRCCINNAKMDSSLTQYTNGVTAFGTPGSSYVYTEITVPLDSPSLYYYCTNHSNMGNIAATFNSTVNVIGGNLFVPTGASGY